MFFLKNTVISALLILSFGLISLAQTQETELIINVKNQLGEVVSDAEITLSKSNQKEKLSKSNKLGITQFSKLTDGEYRINISAAGFTDYQNESIILKKGEIKRLDIILEIATVESKVVISGDEEANTESFGATKTLTEKQIQGLPDDPKAFEKRLRNIAGESATGEQMPISVDGENGGKIPPKDAIQQIRVNQNVFSAQYEDTYGGGIEIFTKSNIEKFSGRASFGFADSRFNASDPFLGKRVPFQSKDFSFSLNGPINKKTSFFMWSNHDEDDTSAVINATILNSSLQPVEFKQSFATPKRSDNISFNIKSDPTKKHKVGLSYYFYSSRNKGQNVGNLSLPSQANNSNSQFHSIRLSDTYLANENVVNQTLFTANYNTNKNFGGNNAVAINVLDAFLGGGSQSDSLNKNLNLEFSNDTTKQIGKYAMGFGIKYRRQQINQTSRNNFGGTYTFSGGIAPVLNANNAPLTDANGNILTVQISSLESYRRTLLFRQLGYSNPQIRTLGGGANQFTISSGNPTILVNQQDYGIYFQNSYKVSPTIAASFGVRYENQSNIKSNLNISPRVGVIWSPKAKEKKKPIFALPRVSIGYGVFYRRFGLNNILNVIQSNGDDRSQYLITDPNILDVYPNVPSITLLQQFALPKSKRLIDPLIQTPYRSLFNINASKKLLFGFSMSATFAYTKNSRQTLTRNINAPLAGTFNAQNSNSAIYPTGSRGNIYETFSNGKGENARFSLRLNFPNSEKLYATIGYSFSKSKNNTVSGSGSPFNAYDFSQEYAPTTNDGVHAITGYISYELPFKFSLGGNFSVSSGSKFNITTGRDTNGDGFYNERPSFATDLSKPNLVKTKYGILDPNPSATDKLIPRNLGKGYASYSFDGSLSKSFGFGEDKKNKKPAKRNLYFSLDVNNLFNIINNANPIGNMSSPNFLRSISSGAGSGFFDGESYIIYGSGNGDFAGRSMNFRVGFSF